MLKINYRYLSGVGSIDLSDGEMSAYVEEIIDDNIKLHIKTTYEGIIIDVVDSNGEVIGTEAATYQEIIDRIMNNY